MRNLNAACENAQALLPLLTGGLLPWAFVLLRYLAKTQPAGRRQARDEEHQIGTNSHEQKQRITQCHVSMRSIANQIRSKPTQADDDISDETDGQNSARRDAGKSVYEQKEQLPEKDRERTGFLDVPRPVTTPFDFRPNHGKDYSARGHTGPNARHCERDTRK